MAVVAWKTTRTAAAAWRALDAPWRHAFELAWQGYRMGAVPAGAVVVSAQGTVLGRARNHEYDADPDHGPVLTRTRLGHAEVNALAGLDPYERHEDAVLYSTVEPCALCVGAAVVATVGTVAYAARDHYAGTAGQVPANPQTARLPLRFEGPLDGPIGVAGAVLRLELYLRMNPDAQFVQVHRQQAPHLVAAAEQLRDDDVLGKAQRKRKRFEDVLVAAWPTLVTADAGPAASATPA